MTTMVVRKQAPHTVPLAAPVPTAAATADGGSAASPQRTPATQSGSERSRMRAGGVRSGTWMPQRVTGQAPRGGQRWRAGRRSDCRCRRRQRDFRSRQPTNTRSLATWQGARSRPSEVARPQWRPRAIRLKMRALRPLRETTYLRVEVHVTAYVAPAAAVADAPQRYIRHTVRTCGRASTACVVPEPGAFSASHELPFKI